MLIVKPDPNNSDNEIKALNAFIDDTPCGFIRFRQRGYILVVTDLLPLPADPENIGADTFAVLDTIIRALGSYGLNHSCYYVECAEPMLYPTLAKLRFVPKDGIMKSNLQLLLKSCGHGSGSL